MRKLIIAALLIVLFTTRAQSNMTLFLQEVGDDVVLHLEGSINTAVISEFPGSASAAELGTFTHSQFQIVTTGGSRGVGSETRVSSLAVQGDVFQFSSDAALTPIGTPPPPQFSHSLNGAPKFWFGFVNATQTSGTPGAIKDEVYLPDGYASNQFISLDFSRS
jgi:hypothetical protein